MFARSLGLKANGALGAITAMRHTAIAAIPMVTRPMPRTGLLVPKPLVQTRKVAAAALAKIMPKVQTSRRRKRPKRLNQQKHQAIPCLAIHNLKAAVAAARKQSLAQSLVHAARRSISLKNAQEP